MASPRQAPAGATAAVAAAEIRDYARINAEVAQRLDAGCSRVEVQGAAGQRLLLAGLRGAWQAEVVIEGDAGPELAASLDAPSLLVVCQGAAGDGAGSGLRAGKLLVLGTAGDAIGYNQAGGTIVAARPVGHRAGLRQAGGVLVLTAEAGRLAGDRQMGGLIIAQDTLLGPHSSRGQQAGQFLRLDRVLAELNEALAGLEHWLPPRTSWRPPSP